MRLERPADTIMNLQYVVNGTPQALQVVAVDGYPIAAGSSGQQSASETSILMPPGSRVEFVVTTPNVGDQAQLTTHYWNTGPDGDFDPARVLATTVSQTGAEGALGVSAVRRLPAKVAGMARKKVLRFAALDETVPVAQRNLAFSEVLENPADPNSPTNFYITEAGNGSAGSNNVTAFYEGESTHSESASALIPVTITDFALSSPGMTAPLGSAAIANVTVNVANDYTVPISFTCTLPPSLVEAACFVDPNSQTGTGVVSLRVNTTASHPAVSSLERLPGHGSGWLKAGGVGSLACVLMIFLPRRRGRRAAMLLLGIMAALFTAAGCSSGVKTDAGTPKGNYSVAGNASSGTGSAQYQTSVNVPITIQ